MGVGNERVHHSSKDEGESEVSFDCGHTCPASWIHPFKGIEVRSFGCRDMQIALALAGGRIIEWSDEGIDDKILAAEDAGICDQPSCAKPSVGRLLIKEAFSDRGDKLHPDDYQHRNAYRQFCKTHIRRGDCSREDCDDNYEPLDGATADDSTNTQESPSGQVTIDMTGDP
jgi:hypothetical protein